jgi:hypothetical protein
MYQDYNNTVAISVNDWLSVGFTLDQFKNDSKRGFLNIINRSVGGNTLIDVKSIKRPDRLRIIEAAFGKIDQKPVSQLTYTVELDAHARDYYLSLRKNDGSPLSLDNVEEYTNRASILNGLRNGLQKQLAARAKAGKRIKMGEFWEEAVVWYNNQLVKYPCARITNVRSLERLFKLYLNNGYEALVHGNLGNDNSRKVSTNIENLLIALWRTNDKPFITMVHQRYIEFISGEKELFDKSTGEVFNPSDFRHKGRALEITEATVWNYLKDVDNNTAVYADRNGNFDYVNSKRPKHQRKLGRYSLSKISMDDVALSRQSVRGWVYKYIAIDVVSGYYFRPAYIVGKPTANTVIESFRNMFCELSTLNLPMPGELEVEYHLMQDFNWLKELFPFVRFCESPTEKRAEHAIKSFKYGTSKREGHTRGRWYANHEAFRSIRNKVSGDFIEEKLQPQTIIADDLVDVIKHNNELHPLQKTYPGMTRLDVLLSQINPDLKQIEPWYLYQFIGNETDTTIKNNDFVEVNNSRYNLVDFSTLKKLKANNYRVTAYWLPEADGAVNKVYLYQDGTYLGEATDRFVNAYNENAIERTDADKAGMLAQNKRISKFDKQVRDRRTSIPKIGTIKHEESKLLNELQTIIIEENSQPTGYEADEFTNEDWTARAIKSI